MKKLGFGFMRLPLLDSDDQQSFDYVALTALVDTFLGRGFTYFDTAMTYHGGQSEAVLRKCVVERYPRSAFTIATKLPPRELTADGDQERLFAQQIERCGVEFYDYYLIHNIGASSYKKAERFHTFEFLAAQKEAGKIRRLGMSFHDTPELLDQVLGKYGHLLDFVQLQINYIDWENPGIQSRRCWEVARKHGLPIVVMEPLKGGSLANVPPEAERLMRARAPDASSASWAMRFAAGQEGVFMVLSGMNSMEQLLDNTSYMSDFKPLDGEELDVIRRVTDILNAQTAVPCTACRYCTDGCPKKIAIPDYFALYNSAMRASSPNFSSQAVYYANLAETHGRARDCIGCGQCEHACPQHLPIVRHLGEVSAAFDGWTPPAAK